MGRVGFKSTQTYAGAWKGVFLLALAWALTILPGAAQKGLPTQSGDELTRQGQQLLRQGKFPDAQTVLQRAVKLAPNSAQARSLLADADAQLGQTAEAIQNYEIVLKLRPNYPPALYNLGILQYRAGKLAAAVGYLEAFHRQSPQDREVLFPLAECLFQLGRKQEGLQAIQAAVAGGDTPPTMLMKAGERLLAEDLVEQAVKPLERSLALAPSFDECRLALALAKTRLNDPESVVRLLGDSPKADEPAYAVLLGSALCRLNRCAEAVQTLEKAIAIDGQDKRLYLKLAEAYAGAGEDQKATQTLEAAHRAWSVDGEIRLALAGELLQAGDPAQAAAVLEEAGSEPLGEAGLGLLARCYVVLNRLPEAEQAAQRAVAGSTPAEASLLALANIYLLQGRDQDIITLLEGYHTRFSDSPKYLFSLALSYFNRGNYSKALDLVSVAIARDPGMAQAQYLAGGCLARSGKLAESIPYYQAAVKIAPDSFLYHLYLGLVLSRVGKKGTAEEELKRSVELNGSHAPAHYELAKVYFDTGRNDLAREELEKATKIDPEFESSYYLLSRVYASLGRNEEASAELKQFREIQEKRREEARAIKQQEGGALAP